MALNRRAILSGLAAVLAEITEVKTVVRTLLDADMKIYATTVLPLIEVQEPDETEDRSLTSQRQIMFLDTVIRVWFVRWGADPNSTYETLVTKIRNKIGDHFTINETATGAWVTRVTGIEGAMPLYHFDMSIRVKYYLDEKSA